MGPSYNCPFLASVQYKIKFLTINGILTFSCPPKQPRLTAPHVTGNPTQDFLSRANGSVYVVSSPCNEKDHYYFLSRFVCAGEFFDG